MKRIAVFVFACSLHAATYHVASTGNDSNDGSSDSPWLTLARAVNVTGTPHILSGDTIIIDANGTPVNCNATLPGLDMNGNPLTNITVQSSKLQYFWPAGWRTNPTNDSAIYGKCKFGAGGAIVAAGEVHGFNQGNTYQPFALSGSTFTLPSGNSWAANGFTLANGSQIDFEINNNLSSPLPSATAAVPSPLVILQHYYVVNCSSSPACGAQNSTFQISATPGGSPITITACNSECLSLTEVGLPIQVSTSANTITTTDGLGSAYANGTPVTFASGGLQLSPAATLPAPLAQDVIYYVRDLASNHFTLAATPGGAVIPLTTVGTGMITVSNATVPSGWKFSGIEFAPASGAFVGNVIVAGSGKEASRYSMVNHFEFDRVWCHDYSETDTGPVRCFVDGAQFLNIHDSYIAGMKGGEAQCIFSLSLGPTAFTNNFCEAAGENTLSGGSYPAYYPLTPQNKQFIGNHLYKPFVWKYTTGVGTPSGTCLYDQAGIDPAHQGGEFYLNTMSSQGYICVNGSWTTTGSIPTEHTIKNIVESKSARNYLYSGNLLQNNWVKAQAGQAFTFGMAFDSGPGFANDHITVMNNKVVGVYEFFQGGSLCTGLTGVGPCLVVPGNQTFNNNLAILGGINHCGIPSIPATCNTTMNSAGLWNGTAQTVATWSKNSLVAPDGIVNANSNVYTPTSWYYGNIFPTGRAALNSNVKFFDSIVSYDVQGASDTSLGFHGYFGVSGDNGWLQTIYPAFQNSTFSHIALIGASGPYGAGTVGTNTVGTNAKPANTAAVKFVNAAGGNYHLDPTSPFSAAGGCATFCSADGTDLGADIDLVNMATSGAAAGTPPWDALAGLRVSLGSTQIVFHYQAPKVNACTATIYRAPARAPANQVTAAVDSSASSVSDGLARELYISGLQASTHYWYKLDCGGGVILVGDVLTRAAGQGTSQFAFDFSAPVAMQYSSSRNMSNAVTLPAAARQFVPVTANSVVYVQVGTAGPVTILIAP